MPLQKKTALERNPNPRLLDKKPDAKGRRPSWFSSLTSLFTRRAREKAERAQKQAEEMERAKEDLKALEEFVEEVEEMHTRGALKYNSRFCDLARSSIDIESVLSRSEWDKEKFNQWELASTQVSLRFVNLVAQYNPVDAANLIAYGVRNLRDDVFFSVTLGTKWEEILPKLSIQQLKSLDEFDLDISRVYVQPDAVVFLKPEEFLRGRLQKRYYELSDEEPPRPNRDNSGLAAAGLFFGAAATLD